MHISRDSIGIAYVQKLEESGNIGNTATNMLSYRLTRNRYRLSSD